VGAEVASSTRGSVRQKWTIGHARAVVAAMPVGRRDPLGLVALGILARALTAAVIHHPNYADAAYYYAVARNVAAGRGLTEDFIFTYMAPAAQVVHPSNLYWMPGASLLLVPFFWVFGSAWWVAQLPNVLLTGTLPALGYALGRDLLGTRRAALGAGLLTLASGFYYPLYDPMPDNFGLYGWAAGGALLLLAQGARGRPRHFALAGLCCGVAHLARPEGPLLLVVAAAVWWVSRYGWHFPAWGRTSSPTRPAYNRTPLRRGEGSQSASRSAAPLPSPHQRGAGHEISSSASVASAFSASSAVKSSGPPSSVSSVASLSSSPSPLPLWSLAALVGLYLLVMAPWFARNLLVVGAPLPPWGLRTAWLRDYDDFFAYQLPLTPASYLAWGWGNILVSKLQALVSNARELAAVMEFVLAPFALLGAWQLRRHRDALPWLLYLLGAYLGLTLVFTFPSVNGSFLHSEVAVLPFLNVAAIAGMDAVIEWAGRRSRAPAADVARRTAERKRVYLGLAVVLSVVLSTFLVIANAHYWDNVAAAYDHAARIVATDTTHGSASGVPSQSRLSNGVTADRAPLSRRNGGGAGGGGSPVVVMVADPVSYYVETGQRAIVIPDQDVTVMAAAARHYGARYLVLEPLHSPAQNALWGGHVHTPLLTLIYRGRGLAVYRWNW
jgi:hypothetical protein